MLDTTGAYSFKNIMYTNSTFKPGIVNSRDNGSYWYWFRYLTTTLFDVIDIEGEPEEWTEQAKLFFKWVLFSNGYIAVFDTNKLPSGKKPKGLEDIGVTFQPCTLYGYDFYYQPTDAVIANPRYSATLSITDGEVAILSMTNNYTGILNIVDYYAKKLANIDASIDVSVINSRTPYIVGAKDKATAVTMQSIFDKAVNGDPLIVYDKPLKDDTISKDTPFQFLELPYQFVTNELLEASSSMLNRFNNTIGIATLPYEKKERMVTSEADSKIVESESRLNQWLETLNSSVERVNELYGCNIKFSSRYISDEEEMTSYDDMSIFDSRTRELPEQE